MKLLKLWNKIGNQPIKATQSKDAIIGIDDENYIVTGVKYINGEFISLIAEKIGCQNCKNNPEFNNGYAPPHTCDICTSLDSEDYEMWSLNMKKARCFIKKERL